MRAGATNWFDQGGEQYARYRPDYPPELATALAQLAPDRRLAVDVGCGNGQFTRQLGLHFDRVIGIDPSADQLAHAATDAKVDYRCAPAEALPLADGSASLITAAQAAHWFDLAPFYGEVRRIAAPGGVIALVSYGTCTLEPILDARFQLFHGMEMAPYWPPERHLVDTGYADIPFPFAPAPYAMPALSIRRSWTFDQLLGYVGTWSAVRRAREAGCQETLSDFANDLIALWGEPGQVRPIVWPIRIRAGLV